MMKSLVVIGSSNIDMVLQLPHLPKAGETVGEGIFSQVNGGKGANQAVAAARAGGRVSFISSVGQDGFGQEAIASFQRAGIDTSGVLQVEGIPTGVALIFVDAKGENSIGVGPGANYQLLPHHIDQASQTIEQAELLLLQLEVPFETVSYAIKKAKELGTKVLLNPAPARSLPDELLSMIDILVVNETEAELISGLRLQAREDILKMAETLVAKGPETVIVTLGSKGAYLLAGGIGNWISAYEVEAIDTTAAGDVFCGSLAVSLMEHKNLATAVSFASAAAAISVTRLGAQPSAPSRAEILSFMQKNNRR